MAGRSPVYVGRANSAILRGDEDLSLWDDEELLRGQRRNRNGKWMGGKPKIVPLAVHQELTRRRLSEAAELLRENLVAATNVLIEIATDPQVEASTRLKAATTIIERVAGKTPEKVELKLGKKAWEEAVEVIFVGENEDIAQVIEVVATQVARDDDDNYDPFGEEV